MSQKEQEVTIISGAGGGKGGGRTRTPREARDSLHSTVYARVIDLISEGEIEGLVNGTDSIFLDGTPLTKGGVSNFDGVSVEYRVGTQSQTPIRGFPAVENGIGVGIEVRDDRDWVQEITTPELSAVRIQVSTPALSKINMSNGDTNGHSISYAIDISTDGGPFREVLARKITGKTTSGYKRSHDIALPDGNAWTIRVRRTSPNANSSTVQDLFFVDQYTEIIEGKFSYPNSAVVGIQVSAEHFDGVPTRAYDVKGIKVRVPSNYDPESRTYSGTWDGSWKIAWTNNPAWIFMDLATHPRYGLGDRIPLGLMDKWSLYEIARYCDQMVPDGYGGEEPRFTCNTYIQTRENAYEVLQNLASIFRGITYYASGSVFAVADQPKSPMFLYNNSNVVDGRFTYSGSPKSTRYTVALVGYNDPNDFFRQKVEYVEDREGFLKYGYQETQLTAFGCSSRGQAHRVGKWALLTSQIETQMCSFTVGLGGVYARPGDLIQIMDQDLRGRIDGGLISDAALGYIVTDTDVEAEPGDDISVTLPNGGIETRKVLTKDGRKIYVTRPFSKVPVKESAWVIYGDVKPQTYRVLSIAEVEGGTQYEFNCVEYREDKFDSIELGTRLDERPITHIPPSIQPPPTDVTITQRVVVDQGIANTIATISWVAPEHAIAYEGFWRKDDGEWVPFVRTGSTSIEIPNVYAGRYVARVYAINALGVRSVAATSAEIQIEGKTTPPPVVTHLRTRGEIYSIELEWGFPQEGANDVLRTEVWISKSNDLNDATKFTDLAYPQNSFSHVGVPAGGEYYYWVRLVDKSGNVGDFYPDGAGVHGMSSIEASDYLDAIRDEVLTTDTAAGLLGDMVEAELQNFAAAAVDAVQDYIDQELDGAIARTITVLENLIDTELEDIEDLIDQKFDAEVSDAIQEEIRPALKSVEVLKHESEELVRLTSEAERHIREDEDALVLHEAIQLNTRLREDAYASLEHLKEVIIGEDGALAREISNLESVFDAQISRVDDELLTLANEDLALAQTISNLESKIDEDIEASITNLQQAIVNVELSLSQSITTLESQFGESLSSSVSSLQEAISDAEQSLASDIATLRSDYEGDLSSAISTLNQTITSTEQALAQSISKLESDLEGEISSSVSSLQEAISDTEQSLASDIVTLRSEYKDDISAAIYTINQTITSKESALNQSISRLDSKFEGDISASISNLQETIADVESSISKSIDILTSSIGDVSATVSTQGSTLTSLDGKLSAQYNIKTAVTSDGKRYAAGIGLGVENNPNGPGFISQILMQADRFALLNTNNNGVTVPFAVQGGQTFINNAIIQNGSISSAKIADAAINNAKIANASINAAKIQDGAITNAKIANATIQTAKIRDAAIDTLKIAGNAVSITVISTASSFSFNAGSGGRAAIFYDPNYSESSEMSSLLTNYFRVTFSGVGTRNMGSFVATSSSSTTGGGGGDSSYTRTTYYRKFFMTSAVINLPSGNRTVTIDRIYRSENSSERYSGGICTIILLQR